MIPAHQWKWFGLPAHFIMADRCRFHLATLVGKYMISTVGDCYPDGPDKPRCQIGCNRFFETYVFRRAYPGCSCGCGMPGIKLSEIDGIGSNTAKEAQKNHMLFCQKYAEMQ